MALTGQTSLTYTMNLAGEPMDEDASNLPVEVKNTVISPANSLKVRAGEKVSFDIELRTANANLRSN